jgi:hypothetical protein
MATNPPRNFDERIQDMKRRLDLLEAKGKPWRARHILIDILGGCMWESNPRWLSHADDLVEMGLVSREMRPSYDLTKEGRKVADAFADEMDKIEKKNGGSL